MIESAGANNQKKMRSYASLKSAISLFFDSVLRAARVRDSTRNDNKTQD
jgi:hypothetical protein